MLSSDKIKQSDDPFSAISSAIMNFYNHYFLDDHSSEWCHHDKVKQVETACQGSWSSKGKQRAKVASQASGNSVPRYKGKQRAKVASQARGNSVPLCSKVASYSGQTSQHIRNYCIFHICT